MTFRGRAAVPSAAVAVLVALLFLVVRLTLLAAREPFFDELFTVWLAKRPFAAIVPALLWDSGPPLYYFLARIPSVTALRFLSLAFSLVPLALLLRRGLRLEALLLAVYPAAVLFAVDARAYSLCAMLVAIGIVLLDDERPWLAAIAFTLAAYSHYYGVFFFPLLLLRPSLASASSRKDAASRILPLLLAGILFLPAFYLAFRQPVQSMQWNREQPWFAPLTDLSFAADSPSSLLLGAPLLLVAVALVALVAAGSRSHRYLAFVLMPVALAIALHFAGRPVYFPLRFQSVLAFPLVLWLGASLRRWQPSVRRILVVMLVAIGAFVLYRGIDDHLRRPLDPYRQAALVLRELAKPADAVVASGYLYLEAESQLGARVIAFPPEQARHPGWRAQALVDPAMLPRTFVWIGERAAPELAVLRNFRKVTPLFDNGRAVIARVEP